MTLSEHIFGFCVISFVALFGMLYIFCDWYSDKIRKENWIGGCIMVPDIYKLHQPERRVYFDMYYNPRNKFMSHLYVCVDSRKNTPCVMIIDDRINDNKCEVLPKRSSFEELAYLYVMETCKNDLDSRAKEVKEHGYWRTSIGDYLNYPKRNKKNC